MALLQTNFFGDFAHWVGECAQRPTDK